jgi:hypothetical protein
MEQLLYKVFDEERAREIRICSDSVMDFEVAVAA